MDPRKRFTLISVLMALLAVGGMAMAANLGLLGLAGADHKVGELDAGDVPDLADDPGDADRTTTTTAPEPTSTTTSAAVTVPPATTATAPPASLVPPPPATVTDDVNDDHGGVDPMSPPATADDHGGVDDSSGRGSGRDEPDEPDEPDDDHDGDLDDD